MACHFSAFHEATAIASDLVVKLENLRASAVSERSLSMTDLEALLMAEATAKRVLRPLLRLTQVAANAEAALPIAAE